MTTAIAHFDSLKAYERLVKADLPESAAKEISEILSERAKFLEAKMAEKEDIEQSENRVTAELHTMKLEAEKHRAELKVELIKWVVGALFVHGSLLVAAMKLIG